VNFLATLEKSSANSLMSHPVKSLDELEEGVLISTLSNTLGLSTADLRFLSRNFSNGLTLSVDDDAEATDVDAIEVDINSCCSPRL